VTFSIVATDGESWGVAVASKFLAVGAVVPAARAGVGAIATQSFANLTYRPDGLNSLVAGNDAQQSLDALTAADELRAERQVGIVDGAGRAATFTGAGCNPWAGGVTGDGYAIQGNILTGPEVVEAMQRAWLDSDPAAALGRRLLAALAAGDQAGGDSRGRQSAALLVVRAGAGYGGADDVYADLRVDDHALPIPELVRLLDVHDVLFGTTDPEAFLPLEGELRTEVGRRLASLGQDDADVEQALATWAGMENYEERLRAGAIDPVLLEWLRARSPNA
jgi:uncharacterized Ntn-hydrolase superfamily protein